MPSFRRKSSTSNLVLHVNPNRRLSQGTRTSLLSKESGYGSTSVADPVKTSVKRSHSHPPEMTTKIETENELLESPTVSMSPSTPRDDVFIETGPSLDYLADSDNISSAVRNNFSLESSTTSMDRQLSEWADYNKVKRKSLDKKEIFEFVKCGVLFAFVVACSIIIAVNPEVEEESFQITISDRHPHDVYLPKVTKSHSVVKLKVLGPFSEQSENNTIFDINDHVIAVTLPNDNNATQWYLIMNVTNLEIGKIVTKEKEFTCSRDAINCNLTLWTDFSRPVPLEYSYLPLGQQAHNGVYYAAAILIVVYILIIFELVHRTVAALIGSFAALAVLSALNERPTIETIISWLDIETMMLLFGMMILVSIFAETGFFDYSALKVYQLAQGEIWPLVTLLCIFSAVVSAFLDNVTTILLLTPVTIRLCEVLNLDPKQILMAEVLFSNIGGTATAIGDPPNVIIVGALASKGISFSVFTVHALLGIIFVIFGAYGFLRFYYRNEESLKNQESPEVRELRHEIDLWKKAASRISVVTREESVMKVLFLQKSVELENELNRELHRQRKAKKRDFTDTYDELQKKYQITDPALLIKSGLVLTAVILILFIHSFVPSIYVGIGWTAVTGAIWLIVLANFSDIDNILHKVEWSTLLFFSALFVLMEALAELGLIQEIGNLVSDIISNVEPDSRIIAAISIIIWISAIASSFIDNIPYTTAMVPVLVTISEDTELNLPILPLVMALAFGACLGGNGTLIGASANVVCSGIAEQHGYGISFKEFFKVGFPMMLVTTLLSHIYLIVCHVLLDWNSVEL